MSIMDLFKPAPTSANNQQGNGSKDTSSKGNDSNNNDGNKGNNDNSGNNGGSKPDANNISNDDKNPFDSYKKLFDNAATKSDIQAPSFNLDPKVVAEVSSKMDFTKGINPELVQKATNGDASAMIGLIQEVGRNAYRASLEHTTKLTDTHLGQRSEFDSKRLQKGVREQLTNDALASSANLNHPVIKAELNRIAKQFAASDEYADASPQEIANAAKKYLNDLHSAMNPEDPSKTKDGKDRPMEVDYMKYLGGE